MYSVGKEINELVNEMEGGRNYKEKKTFQGNGYVHYFDCVVVS